MAAGRTNDEAIVSISWFLLQLLELLCVSETNASFKEGYECLRCFVVHLANWLCHIITKRYHMQALQSPWRKFGK
jgi:hypothetical protein